MQDRLLSGVEENKASESPRTIPRFLTVYYPKVGILSTHFKGVSKSPDDMRDHWRTNSSLCSERLSDTRWSMEKLGTVDCEILDGFRIVS